jgi:divalent metal cation (Fe/Co/Zn/Cd) transporter
VQLNNKLEGVIQRVSDAKIVSIKLRWAGPVIFSEIVLQMNPRLPIEEAHRQRHAAALE